MAAAPAPVILTGRFPNSQDRQAGGEAARLEAVAFCRKWRDDELEGPMKGVQDV